MSHELRTPLNSLLILAKLLSDNQEETLTEKQVEFAKTIYNAGTDLLELINDILDLSKVEAGKMDVNPQPVDAGGGRGLRRADVPARSPTRRGSSSRSSVDDGLPATIVTDEQRLQQVLKNLLSNAFKFTEQGARHADDRAGAERDALREPTLRDGRRASSRSRSPTPASGSRRTSCS